YLLLLQPPSPPLFPYTTLFRSRTADAIGLFEKALAMDPNRTDSLLWLGNIYRSESNFAEAIRLHQHANRIDDRNIEVLLELAKRSEEHTSELQSRSDLVCRLLL